MHIGEFHDAHARPMHHAALEQRLGLEQGPMQHAMRRALTTLACRSKLLAEAVLALEKPIHAAQAAYLQLLLLCYAASKQLHRPHMQTVW